MNTSLVIQYQINSQGELTEQGGTKYETDQSPRSLVANDCRHPNTFVNSFPVVIDKQVSHL